MWTLFKTALILGLCLSAALANPKRRYRFNSEQSLSAEGDKEIYDKLGEASLHVPKDSPEARSFSITVGSASEGKNKKTTATTEKPDDDKDKDKDKDKDSTDDTLTTLKNLLTTLTSLLSLLGNFYSRTGDVLPNDPVAFDVRMQEPQLQYYAGVPGARFPMWMNPMQANADMLRATTFQANAGMPLQAVAPQANGAYYFRQPYPTALYTPPAMIPQPEMYPEEMVRTVDGQATRAATTPQPTTTPVTATGAFPLYPFPVGHQGILPGPSGSGTHWQLVRDTPTTNMASAEAQHMSVGMHRRAGRAMLTENAETMENKEDAPAKPKEE